VLLQVLVQRGAYVGHAALEQPVQVLHETVVLLGEGLAQLGEIARFRTEPVGLDPLLSAGAHHVLELRAEPQHDEEEPEARMHENLLGVLGRPR